MYVVSSTSKLDGEKYIHNVGITYKDNCERVDYISMYHFRASS